MTIITQSLKGAAITPKQQRVLVLLVEGHQNKVIADRMGVCTQTIDRHIHSIGKRLGGHGRVSIALWAYRNGIKPEGMQ